jgi:CHRD domain-containing protein
MIFMYLKQARILLIVIVATVLILATATITITRLKPVLAQSDTSATATTSINPSSASGQQFSAKMTGDGEVPPVDTDATGTIRLSVAPQQTDALNYDLTITNLNGAVTGAHIHMGVRGNNGPIIANLNTPGASAASASSSAGEGSTMTSNSVGGTITSLDLKGPLAGKQISDLVRLIEDGRAYTNVHTEQHPNGEIRGQLVSSLADTTNTDNSGSTSTSTSTSPSASASATSP